MVKDYSAKLVNGDTCISSFEYSKIYLISSVFSHFCFLLIVLSDRIVFVFNPNLTGNKPVIIIIEMQPLFDPKLFLF